MHYLDPLIFERNSRIDLKIGGKKKKIMMVILIRRKFLWMVLDGIDERRWKNRGKDDLMELMKSRRMWIIVRINYFIIKLSETLITLRDYSARFHLFSFPFLEIQFLNFNSRRLIVGRYMTLYPRIFKIYSRINANDFINHSDKFG